MLDRDSAKELIKETVKTSIMKFAEASLKKKPTFQILDLIIPKERRIRSVVGGLKHLLGLPYGNLLQNL